MTAPLLLLRPDGSRPLTEQFEFLTDISTSLNGTEGRDFLRAHPYYTFTAQYMFPESDYGRWRDMLRYSTGKVGIPLLMHELQRGEANADAGVSRASKLLVTRKTGNGELLQSYPPILSINQWSTARHIYPYVEGWIDSSRTISHRNSVLSTTVLSFRVEDLDETVEPWTGTLSHGLPLWPERADWSTEVSERIDDAVDVADSGHRRLREVRYSKRIISVSLMLRGRPAILDFRTLLHTLKGRYLPFRYTFEPDGAERTWRLNSDNISIDYFPKNRVARVNLEFLELNE